jgi:hypothetical protein
MTTMAAASPLNHGCWAAKNPTVTARYTALLNRASVTVLIRAERIFNVCLRCRGTQKKDKSGQTGTAPAVSSRPS